MITSIIAFILVVKKIGLRVIKWHIQGHIVIRDESRDSESGLCCSALHCLHIELHLHFKPSAHSSSSSRLPRAPQQDGCPLCGSPLAWPLSDIWVIRDMNLDILNYCYNIFAK